MALITGHEAVFIEREENYLKQTFRNRCTILAANGPQILTVPVMEGSFHKRAIKDIKIDYSRRWKQVHLRSMTAAYSSSPFFEYYFAEVERVVESDHKYLLDLNYDSLSVVAKIIGIDTTVRYTTVFSPESENQKDYRYTLAPKGDRELLKTGLPYAQVFSDRYGFTDGLSILDLLFNTGPDAADYLRKLTIRI
jgi:hypothetical protein